MALLDEANVAEIEQTVAYQRKRHEVTYMTEAAANLCETLRAAWKERDDLLQLLKNLGFEVVKP